MGHVGNLFLGIENDDCLLLSAFVETNVGGSNRTCRDNGEGEA